MMPCHRCHPEFPLGHVSPVGLGLMVSLHEILLHHLLFQVENETHTHKELTSLKKKKKQFADLFSVSFDHLPLSQLTVSQFKV